MRFYIGCEIEAVPNWRDILPPVTAPANYKNPEKIAAYIADMTDKLEFGDAAKGSLSGMISRAVLITPGAAGDPAAPDTPELLTENGQPKIVLDTSGPGAGPEALEYMMSAAEVHTVTDLENLAIFGIDIRRNARLMALQYIHTGHSLPYHLHWAVDFEADFGYNRVPGFVDPLHVLFGRASDWRGKESARDPIAAGLRLGLPVDPEDAESMAVFAFQLLARLGL